MPAPAVRFPAEWEPQSAILLTWPHSETDWAPNLAAAEATFAAIAQAVLAREHLLVAVHRAAPFGDVSNLPRPWRFSEVFLFRDDKRFKPRSLDL